MRFGMQMNIYHYRKKDTPEKIGMTVEEAITELCNILELEPYHEERLQKISCKDPEMFMGIVNTLVSVQVAVRIGRTEDQLQQEKEIAHHNVVELLGTALLQSPHTIKSVDQLAEDVQAWDSIVDYLISRRLLTNA